MSCATGSGSIACWVNAQADILTNIANNLIPVEHLITGAAYLMGISFVIKGIFCLKQHGETKSSMSQNSSFKEPLLYFLVGSVFLYFPTAFAVLMDTTFGYSNVLAYSALSTNNRVLNELFSPGNEAGIALATIISGIGLIAFIRGWILIARAGSQGQSPGGTSKGLIHVVGGIMAMNVIGTLQVINNTLYG